MFVDRFGNFPAMMLGMRLEPTVEVLRERYADTYQLGFLAAARIGVAWERDADFLKVTNIKPTP